VKLFWTKSLSVLIFALVGIASRSDASIITVPTGLAPGTQYRLIFVTNGTYTAGSPAISTYNADIANEVALIPQLAALGATWYAIGSTDTTSAIANIGVSPSTVGVYLLNGTTLVANGTGTTGTGLFSGSILSGIGINDLGLAIPTEPVWTGTLANGQGATAGGAGCGSDCTLGDATTASVAGQTYIVGTPTPGWWIDDAQSGDANSWQLYGVSSVLTVQGTPEPGSIALAALGLASLFLARRCKQQKCFWPINPTADLEDH